MIVKKTGFMIFRCSGTVVGGRGRTPGTAGGVERESAGARLRQRLPRLPRVARQTWRAQIAGSGRWWYSACG